MSRAIELGLVLLAACLGCGGSFGSSSAATGPSSAPAEVTRLRLLLSDNPVDSGGAFRCHAECQQQDTPDGYVACLSACPGFERTPGVACTPDEIPPVAACFTAREAPAGSEPGGGAVVVAVIGDVPFLVGVSAVCASQTEPCGYAGAGLAP